MADGKNHNTRRKARQSATLSTLNFTQTESQLLRRKTIFILIHLSLTLVATAVC